MPTGTRNAAVSCSIPQRLTRAQHFLALVGIDQSKLAFAAIGAMFLRKHDYSTVPLPNRVFVTVWRSVPLVILAR